ncbi:MAG: NAD(P)-dependent oxidoreductase [Anaerolineae bacterium]|nr:NAD(P)-dependent oxidoreductase [Anaerolineae bacterium]
MTLSGKTVLVTGASGFLGSALTLRLATDGALVKALARRPEKARFLQGQPNISIVQGDITDAGQMRAAADGCQVVFHVAAALGGPLAEQRLTNVDGTRRVMLAAAAAGVERVVHVSSIAVYGYAVRGDITEDTPQEPGRVPYARTKSEAETVVQEIGAEYSLPYSIIRPGMIYGPRSGAWTVTMFKVGRRKPTIWFGDGSGSTHPVYVDDVVDLTVLLATHPAAVNEAFNCAADPAPNWRTFIGSYSRMVGHESWLGIPILPVRLLAPLIDLALGLRNEPQDVDKLAQFVQTQRCYKMTKARDLLGWQPRVDLATGMKHSEAWLREVGLLQ